MWCQGATAWMDLAAKAQEVIVKWNRDEEKEWREEPRERRLLGNNLPPTTILISYGSYHLHVWPCSVSHNGSVQEWVPNPSIFPWDFKLWKRTYHLLEAGPCGRSQYVVRSNKVGAQKSSQDKIVSAGLEYLSCSCNQLYPCPSLAYLFNLSSYFMSQFLSISKTS